MLDTTILSHELRYCPKISPMLLQDGKRTELVKKFKEIGYKYVTIDMEGYRSGSMNEVL